jgi:hypothetical protein
MSDRPPDIFTSFASDATDLRDVVRVRRLEGLRRETLSAHQNRQQLKIDIRFF